LQRANDAANEISEPMKGKYQAITAIIVLIFISIVEVPCAHAHNIYDLLITLAFIFGFFVVITLVVVGIIMIIGDLIRNR
jgi:hypothetical protein